MAILQGIPGLQVTIHAGGSALIEYPDNEEEAWTKQGVSLPDPNCQNSVYVQVVGQPEFFIKVETTRDYIPNSGLSFVAEVDGTPICQIQASEVSLRSASWSGIIDGLYRRVNHTYISRRPLKFNGLIKVDDASSDRIEEDTKLVRAGLGEIVVYVHRSQIVPTDQVHLGHDAKEVAAVSEKAMKGKSISHSVNYGAEQQLSRPRERKTVFLDGQWRPKGVFRFKYRSKEALQSELIIPRSPSPGAVEQRSSRPDHTRRVQQDVRPGRQNNTGNLKEENVEIKVEEVGRDTGRKRPGSDNPKSERPSKTSKSRKVVVIDLTDD